VVVLSLVVVALIDSGTNSCNRITVSVFAFAFTFVKIVVEVVV